MKILIFDSLGYSKKALEIYSKLGEVYQNIPEDGKLPPYFSEAEVLVIRLNKVTAEMMNAAPNLKIIASPTTGLNHIDLNAAEGRGIKVVSLKGKRGFLDKIYATSEHSLALMLALLRRLPAAHAHVLSGGWDRSKFIGNEISGKTVGIVGLGRLGSRLAQILHCMGAEVIAADPFADKSKIPPHVSLVGMPELLEKADIVSVHVPLEDATRNMFGEKEFNAMKPGVFFVNTSRGEVVEEKALLGALESGRLAGAAIDVMSGEGGNGTHLLDNGLLAYARSHDNLIITPHIGGATGESMAATEEFIANEVSSALA